MTPREKRTVRLGAIVIIFMFAAFIGFQAWKMGSRQRVEYRQLLKEAQDLKTEVKRYDDRIAVVKKLMENFHMDPARLVKTTVVAEASSAIQKAAAGGGFQLGPIRETPTRAAGRELASIQFEGSGPVKAASGLLQRLKTLGYPLIIDSAQFTSDPQRPGQLKLKLTVVILDFEQWKNEETPHA
jgi:hypothetical protein